MYYIFESVFVGIYNSVIYTLLSYSGTDCYTLLFITGFFKHLFGFLLGVHTFYCNNGYACTKNIENNENRFVATTSKIELLLESIFEGFLFIGVGFFLSLFITSKSKVITVFMIGSILHIVFETLPIHNLFCENKSVLVK